MGSAARGILPLLLLAACILPAALQTSARLDESSSTVTGSTESETSEDATSTTDAPTPTSATPDPTTTTPDPTTTTTLQPTTTLEPPPFCTSGHRCTPGTTCEERCGLLQLPQNPPQEGSPVTSTVRTPNPSQHRLRVWLNPRSLQKGEVLEFRDDDSRQPRASTLSPLSANVTCNTAAPGDTFVFHAWTGVLVLHHLFVSSSTEECPVPQGVREVRFNSVKQGELIFPEDSEPLPLEGGEWEWSVPVTPEGGGYGVNITVRATNLMADLGDFLAINPGLQQDSARSMVLSWRTDPEKPRQLRLLGRDAFHAVLHLGPRTVPLDWRGIGFSLNYTNFNPVTTTPPPTTTPEPLPMPPAEESGTLLAYVGGVNSTEFVERIYEFNASMAELANKFCEIPNSGITLEREIEPKHVQVVLVARCPETWPSWELCSRVVFSIPAFTNSSEPEDYQLTAANLDKMWRAMNTSLLEHTLPVPMTRYAAPSSDFWWWIGVTLGVLVLVVLLIIAAWRVEMHQQIHGYGSKSDSLIGSGSSDRDSYNSANKSPHQVVPPYMVMEHEEKPGLANEIYSDHPWEKPYVDDARDSFNSSSAGGMVNEAYEDDEDVVVFRRPEARHVVFASEYISGSEDENEIIEAVGPARTNAGQDLTYDTPSMSSEPENYWDSREARSHISLRDHQESETVL